MEKAVLLTVTRELGILSASDPDSEGVTGFNLDMLSTPETKKGKFGYLAFAKGMSVLMITMLRAVMNHLNMDLGATQAKSRSKLPLAKCKAMHQQGISPPLALAAEHFVQALLYDRSQSILKDELLQYI
jgi:hypothetical protein